MTSAVEATTLHQGWRVYRSSPGAIAEPGPDSFAGLEPLEVTVPGSLFQQVGQGIDAEDFDWWYSCDFMLENPGGFSHGLLRFEGLATLAEVWLNGTLLVSSENMFVPVSVGVDRLLTARNSLVLVFRSLNGFLQQKRPRPRWKTNLTNHQQLRWLRTSLLGRMPGWTPPTPALGPVGTITLERWNRFHLDDVMVQTRVEQGVGIVDVQVQVNGAVDSLHLLLGEHSLELTADAATPGLYSGRLAISQPELWWPHTHGVPNRYACRLQVHAGEVHDVDLGYRAFRALGLESGENRFQLQINDLPLFVRGACWTHVDMRSFQSAPEALRQSLTLARDAGLNMLRIGGTMTYETDAFYALCDELGILVWQDFMFANMDYPVDDAGFLNAVTEEASCQLRRLSQYACVAVYCGNSEIQQQAAMMGMARDQWSNVWFDARLPELCAELHPGVPYIPSTPYGGALPFHIGTGVTHFYGVGAYRKSLAGSGLDKVRFTTETLGFSHVPEPDLVEDMFGGAQPVCHSPLWKAGIPRDGGAGWDFEDIRDHYFRELWGQDPVTLRSRDTGRYLALSRVVTGELVKSVIGHWRSPATPCAGALLWFYRDLVAGAGWGMLDYRGRPKAAYYYVKQACSPLAGFLLDQGLDGLNALVVNDGRVARQLRLEIRLLAGSRTVIDQVTTEIEVPAHGCWQENVEGLLGHFRDLTYSYQFGLPQHDLVTLQLFDAERDVWVAGDTFFPQSLQLKEMDAVAIESSLEQQGDDVFLLLRSDSFLQSVTLDISKGEAEDQYFHLVPGVVRHVRLRLQDAAASIVKGYVSALNLASPERLRLNRVVGDAV